MDFSGRRVLVTGAGKGIGRSAAAMLAARGASVVALSRNAADLLALEAEIGCETIVADLADASAAEAGARAALPIDLLVNCAGTTTLESFLDTSAETFDGIMAVNARAPVLIAKVIAADMIRRGVKGAIVNVSSLASLIGIRDHVAYCASKGALDAATRVMALELGPHGIRVNAVNPVVTLTPMAVKAWSDPAKAGAMQARIPLGRFVEPDEVSEAILYLLSDAARMITGTCLPIDGGFLAN
jgi:NAD(P)-dependent dehydrogenase (short-subunit alcohol dehydrogenase family)